MKVSSPVVLVDKIPLDMARRLYERAQRDGIKTDQAHLQACQEGNQADTLGNNIDLYA